MLVVALAVAIGLRFRAPIRVRDLAIAMVPAAAIGGWWFVRNIVTFHSLVPPLQPLTKTHPYLRSLGALGDFASGAVRSLFGPERADGGPLVRSFPIQVLIGVFFAGVVIVLTVAGLRAVREWPGLDRPTRQVAMVLTAVCAFMVALWILNSVFFDLQPQSRYLFVAVAAPATAMAWAGVIHRPPARVPIQGRGCHRGDLRDNPARDRLPPGCGAAHAMRALMANRCAGQA